MLSVEKNKKRILPLKKGKKYRVLSLFSGCGGMDLGFEGDFEVYAESIQNYSNKDTRGNWSSLPPTPFQIVFANDICKKARDLWTNYFCPKYGYSPDIYLQNSIVDLVKQHKKGENIFPNNIDLVIGGFPCQDFSLSGKRKGFYSKIDHKGNIIEEDNATEETRGKLYMWMKEVIDITEPKIFIAENVKGLVNLEDVKDIIQHDFSTSGGDGYIVLPPRILNAARYGVPQTRERVIFIGIKRSALKENALINLSKKITPDLYDPYPKETHRLPIEHNKLNKAITVGKVLSELSEPEESDDQSHKVYSKAKYMGSHCQGQKEIDLNNLAPTIRSEHHGNIEFRRLSSENGGKHKEELLKGMKERRLTPRECAMIQTFPKDYNFVTKNPLLKNRYLISPSAAYKAIGNAVPPLLAYHIANRIDQVWSIYFK